MVASFYPAGPAGIIEIYSVPTLNVSSPLATAQNQEFWAQGKTRCGIGTYQIGYILSSTILVPSPEDRGSKIHDHIVTSLCFQSKFKLGGKLEKLGFFSWIATTEK